ncbi:MAG: ABC transporter ATP-binding protein [Actinomycetota bacterium]|nr:ABC transporter ATP-binding protein [Actinomycetota bacterium]
MLQLRNVNVSYDGLQTIWDVSMEVGDKRFVSLIGSNGAGKTTLLRTISGLKEPQSGNITWNGREIAGMQPNKICELGIIHVPEGRKIFPNMTVRDNLEMGAYLQVNRKHLKDSLHFVFEVFPLLEQRRKQYAATLSGGEQQMLAIARGLMGKPELLMLDEPSLGLSPKMAGEVFERLGVLSSRGLSILLVSQEIPKSLKLSDTAYVMENGRIMMQGSGEELLKDNQIRKHYLGI